jgi:transcription elongation factor GreA
MPPAIPLTQDTITALNKEQASLRAERKEVLKRLATAREMGDLSENGAYKYAKQELGRVSRRLGELNPLIAQSVLLEKPANPTHVELGCSVTVDDGKQHTTYQIVTEHESDPFRNKLSFSSPLGSALRGKKPLDTVTFDTPSGTRTLQIISIS